MLRNSVVLLTILMLYACSAEDTVEDDMKEICVVAATTDKPPARVLSSRMLSDGKKEIVVQRKHTFKNSEGKKCVYAEYYTCVKTVYVQGQKRQTYDQCLPKAVIATKKIMRNNTRLYALSSLMVGPAYHGEFMTGMNLNLVFLEKLKMIERQAMVERLNRKKS